MHVFTLLALLAAGPTLDQSQVSSDPYRLVEIRVAADPPEGFDVATQEWLILDPAVDWRQYENGSVLVATAPPGAYQARWRGQYIDWEAKQFKSEWRVFNIRIRGPPEPVPPVPDDPDPPEPVDLTGDVYSIVIRKASQLTAGQSEALLRIRRWVDQREGFQHLEFPPDAESGDGSVAESVASYVSKIPEDATLPYGFVLQQKRGAESAYVHWQGEVLSAEQVIDTLQGVAQ